MPLLGEVKSISATINTDAPVSDEYPSGKMSHKFTTELHILDDELGPGQEVS